MSDFPTIAEIRHDPINRQFYVEAQIRLAVELNKVNSVEIADYKWPLDPSFIDMLKSKGYNVTAQERVGKGFYTRPFIVYTVSWE